MSDLVAINLSADETTNEFAKASALRTAIYEAAHNNSDDQFKYDSAIRDYNANLATGSKNPDLKVPEAPFKWVVEPAIDAPDGYAAAVRSTTERLTSLIPIATFNASDPKPVYPPNTIAIGHQIGNTAWYTALDNDTVPAGKTVMGPDGHMYEKWNHPFRTQGQYEQVG